MGAGGSGSGGGVMTAVEPSRIIVVAPTYDEIDNIADFLTAVRRSLPEADILIVDDASPDGTADRADAVGSEIGGVTVLRRPAKVGLGSAYRHGFSVAVGESDDDTVVVSMDVDASHDPEDLPRLIAAIDEGADLVIGSRYVPGGGTRHWSWSRRWLSRWGNRYTAAVLGTGVRDSTSGYRAYRAGALRDVDIESTTAEGYAFLTEVVWRMSRCGHRVVEIPIVFTDRIRGQSKMSGRIIMESMLLVTRWGLSRMGRASRGQLDEHAPRGSS